MSIWEMEVIEGNIFRHTQKKADTIAPTTVPASGRSVYTVYTVYNKQAMNFTEVYIIHRIALKHNHFRAIFAPFFTEV